MSKSEKKSQWDSYENRYTSTAISNLQKGLDPGIYRMVIPPMGSWYLERIGDHFEFPYKIYDSSQDIIDRIVTHWQANNSNLGVLFNGLRGAGKTLTAQLLANRLIEEEGLPVILVKSPIPLEEVYSTAHQDMMVFFDEFEKSHYKEEHQNAILSVIDGTSRSSYKRLVLFTTNQPKINENFKDRPSRIHYKFEFERISDEVIKGLLYDILPAECLCFATDVLSFLKTREICTIDVVKAVLNEVKTFGESPYKFEKLLNISRGRPPAFKVEILDRETKEPIRVFSEYFQPNDTSAIPYLMDSEMALNFFRDYTGRTINAFSNSKGLQLLDKLPEDGLWISKLKVKTFDTPYCEYGRFLGYNSNNWFWIDNKPEGWKLPSPREIERDPSLEEKLDEMHSNSTDTDSVYGTGEPAIFLVRITREDQRITYETRFKPSDWGDANRSFSKDF